MFYCDIFSSNLFSNFLNYICFFDFINVLHYFVCVHRLVILVSAVHERHRRHLITLVKTLQRLLRTGHAVHGPFETFGRRRYRLAYRVVFGRHYEYLESTQNVISSDSVQIRVANFTNGCFRVDAVFRNTMNRQKSKRNSK